MDDKELLYEAAKLSQFDACDSIWWRWNSDRVSRGTRLMVLVNCNDLFEWGCADAEELTEENLPILKQAIADVEEVSGSEYDCQAEGFLLFCCRVRKMRPQGAYYPHLKVRYGKTIQVQTGNGVVGSKFQLDQAESDRRTERLCRLFDYCGPPRDIDLGNPKDQDGAYKFGKDSGA